MIEKHNISQKVKNYFKNIQNELMKLKRKKNRFKVTVFIVAVIIKLDTIINF